jgi:hypothetical protein
MEAPLDNSPLDKPTDVFDRDAEWADLTAFALSPLPGPLPGRGQRSGIRVILSDTGPLAAEFCAAIADDELRVIEITPHV